MRHRRLPFDYAIRNLGRRPLRTGLTALSAALVAALIVATTAFVSALDRAFRSAAPADTAIVLSASAQRDLVRSAITPAVAELIAAEVEGVAIIGGAAAVSPEIHMGTNVELVGRPAGERGPWPAFVRGTTPRAFAVHDAVTLIEGKPARTGEVIVGRLAAAKMGVDADQLAVGRRLRFEGGEFEVAGIFAAPGTTIESEIWAPLHELKGLARREDVSAVFVRVTSPDALADVDLFAKRRLDLELVCIPAEEYYAEAAAYFRPIRALAWLMALMVGAAAALSGANTMGAAVQDRIRELATLRALGYPGLALVRSLLTEALVLSAAGGLGGLVLARGFLTGAAVRLAMSAFRLEVDGRSIVVGFLGVLGLGALGTLPAALRILRLPVATGLKES